MPGEETAKKQSAEFLEKSIRIHAEDIRDAKHSIKLKKEKLDDLLMGYSNYSQAVAEVKKANLAKRVARLDVISGNKDAYRLNEEIGELRHDVKSKQLMLSEDFFQFNELTGKSEVEGSDGKVIKFKKRAVAKGL